MDGDAVFANASFHTLEREGQSYAAMRVDRRGRIAELYPAGAPVPPGAVDLGGATVVPAFIDAHAHFLSKAALAALGVGLSRLEGGRVAPDRLEGVRGLLAERAAATRGPVLGFGLALGALSENRLPSGTELDAWLPGREVLVFSMDGHSSSYSSQALARLGLASAAVDGVLSGEAHEFNMGAVTRYMMRGLGPAALARGLSAAVAEAIEGGLCCVHCLEGTEGQSSDPAMALFGLVGGRLGLGLRLWPQYVDPIRAERASRGMKRRRVGGCLAWEMDGSVSSRTAAFDRNYLDSNHAGTLYRTADEARAMAAPFYRGGWQLSAHAIGPRGIESILSAYESLLDEAGEDNGDRRLRIDHFEFPRPDQVQRAGRRRMVLTVQPGFAWADARYIGSYERALDAEARAGQCPLRSLDEAGCVVALSTDAPVQPLNPFVQIAGAVDHPVASQRLSVYQALRAYSWAGAYSTFEDGERGTLAVGKYADFVALDTDPFAASVDGLLATKALGTWRDGRRLSPPPAGLAGFSARVLATRRSPT